MRIAIQRYASINVLTADYLTRNAVVLPLEEDGITLGVMVISLITMNRFGEDRTIVL
jgi:hypothetical protein